MSDLFQITPYKVRSAGTDVPPEEVQAGINSLALQTTIALNAIVAGGPVGPAGGDLSGTYPNPTVTGSHITSGTINGASVGQTTPAAGSFTTLTATTPVGVASGGTGRNALSANNVLIGEGTSAVNFAAPGAAGNILSSTGPSADPAFQTAATLGLAPLASPAFTGTPTAPTAAAHTNTTQLATTAFVETEFASPPTAGVGSVTPSPGSFTTLNASALTHLTNTSAGASVLELTGNGVTTPNKFLGVLGGIFNIQNSAQSTNILQLSDAGGLTVTGSVTPSTTGGIVGTATNDSANAGSVGEFVTATATAVSLTANTPANVTSISLTAGDWDVTGNVQFNANAGTTIAAVLASVGTTSATLNASPDRSINEATQATANPVTLIAPVQRISIASTTTVFLVGNSNFTGGTATADGRIRARRIR